MTAYANFRQSAGFSALLLSLIEAPFLLLPVAIVAVLQMHSQHVAQFCKHTRGVGREHSHDPLSVVLGQRDDRVVVP